jgi:hypothetical protein
MNIARTDLAIASALIQDELDEEVTREELKERLEYLIEQNNLSYDLLEDDAELQYALGDTQEILRLLLKKL